MQPNGANKNNEDQAIISNAGPYLKRPDDTNKPSVIPKIYKLRNLTCIEINRIVQRLYFSLNKLMNWNCLRSEF